MDFLSGHYLEMAGQSHIIEPSEFNRNVTTLKRRLREILVKTLPGANAQQLDLMIKHVQGLNWYPFRHALYDLAGEVHLGFESKTRMRREIERFKTNRDELVHRARFKSNDPWREYAFMMTFIGKVLLAILGYDGYYCDWTKPPGWVGPDSEMRVKLELNP